MSEFIRTRALIASTLLAIGASACGGGEGGDATNSKASETTVFEVNDQSPQIFFRYLPNGVREIVFDEFNKYREQNPLNNILQFCDYGQLVEVVEDNVSGNFTPGGLSRTKDYEPCDDNQLTPSDFPPTDSSEKP